MDYISTKDAATKFGISDRRVQKLCESGRIPGSQMISGVWLIPSVAEKPIDERYTQLTIFENDEKRISLSELCKGLSISLATGKNWVKLGKIVPDSIEGKMPYFTIEHYSKMKSELSNGKNTALKSRRNKKYVSGNEIYKDYVSPNSLALGTVQQILSLVSECNLVLTDTIISYLLAECAVQLIGQRFCGKALHLIDFLNDTSSLGQYANLVLDLIADKNAHTFIHDNAELFNPLYRYEDGEDTLGLLYISLNNIGDRKAKGAYYTPTKVVNKLIRSIQETHDFSKKKIIDPCCGTGNFLLQLPLSLSVDHIYGSDIDEASIKIARINIALKYSLSDCEVLYKNFVVRNYLFESDSKQFDIIIGNPPWGFDFSEQDKVFLKEKYASAYGRSVESYDVFIEQALRELRDNGILSFVLPEAILNVKAHSVLREIILQKTSIQYLEMLGNAFDKVQCPCIILQLRKTNKLLDTKGMVVVDGKRKYTITESRKTNSECFSFMTTDEEYSIIKTIESIDGKTTLKDNGVFALGIVTGNNKEYITNKKLDDNEMVLKGSDICKYVFKPTDNFIRFVPDSFQQVAPTDYYRAKEKLLYRFICNQLVFAYDNNQTLSLNSCNLLIPTFENLKIKYVMAVLNSSIAQFFFKKQYNSVKVLRSHIEQIPIPVVSEKKQEVIIELVDRICEESDSKKIQNLYNEIDSVLAEHFGLSNKELAYIQSQNETNLFLP